MTGIPTRSSARHAAIKTDTASTRSDDGTISDATADGTPLTTTQDSSTSSQAHSMSARDHAASLSEDLEPMSLDDDQHKSADDATACIVTAHDEIDPLGQHVKEAAAALSKLEGLGLQKFDISLPRCIVLGQQSTGKSSVIEAISGIKTPRDTDTCTCCPLYINMKPSDNPGDKWTARVSLQRDFAPDLRPKTMKGAREEFPGWTPTTSSQVFFAETQSRNDLEYIIRSAQSANLNPHKDPQTFLTALGTGNHQHKFSPNIVCIEIVEPGLPSLSFFDLPGIIAQAETEAEEYTVALVRNLVGQYVREEGSLILVTCDLGTDIANSTAAGLARKYRATDRCIGVLTKPDLIAPGTTDQSLYNVLQGNRFPLGHGYFVVKNLNKEQIASGLGHREARINEAEFFSNGRWANNLYGFKDRFGTRNLQLYLSRELAKRTFTRLPEIYEQITAQLEQVEAELKEIPVTPGHSAVRAITDHILEFTQEVRHEMEGAHGHTDWWNSWEILQRGFKDAIMAMKPTMGIKGKLDEGIHAATLSGTSKDDAFIIHSDDDDYDTDVPMSNTEATPTKKRKVEEASPAPTLVKTPLRATKRQPAATPSRPGQKKKSEEGPKPEDFARFRKRFVLDDVVREIHQTSKSKIPDQIHPNVRDAMIIQPLKEWHRPVEIFFSTLESELSSRMQCLFTKHFATRQGTELFRNAWKIVHEILRNNINEQQNTMALEALTDELEGPYIFHGEVFAQEKDAVREIYRQHRSRMRFKVFIHEAQHHRQQDITQTEQDKVRKDGAKMAIIEREPYDTVINLIAEVTGYYNLAARRFHDSICMRIQSKFFKQLREQLRDELETGLGLHGDSALTTAQRLLVESPEHEVRRQQLLSHKKALTMGLECLQELRDKYSSVPSGGAHGDGRGGAPGSSMVTPPAEET
ncbi:hypothetical protein NX059_011234 [Plenodomus lindquistii]|nr:hypothetical protein NX059_011234 [Plenodomus lindquistii]